MAVNSSIPISEIIYSSDDIPIPRTGFGSFWSQTTKEFVVFGGYNGEERLSDVWCLKRQSDLSSGSKQEVSKDEENEDFGCWKNVTPKNYKIEGRAGFTLVPTNKQNSWILFGGYNSERFVLSDSHLLEIEKSNTNENKQEETIENNDNRKQDINSEATFSTFSWKKITYISTPQNLERRWHSSCTIAEKMIVSYGWNDNGPLNDIKIFDLNSHRWSDLQPRGNMSARRWHTCCSKENKLFYFGGYDGKALKDFSILDLEKNVFLSPKPTTKAPMERCRHTATWVDSKQMAIIGGYADDSLPLKEIWIWRSDDSSWKLINSGIYFPSFKAGHSATMIDENKMLVFGGFDFSKNPTNTSVIIDKRSF